MNLNQITVHTLSDNHYNIKCNVNEKNNPMVMSYNQSYNTSLPIVYNMNALNHVIIKSTEVTKYYMNKA